MRAALFTFALFILGISFFTSCSKEDSTMPCNATSTTEEPIPVSEPLFPNSIVSTDIDFIQESDPDAFTSLIFMGLEDKEMPSSLSEELFDTDTYIFNVEFSNSSSVEIWAHSSFGTQLSAQEYAEKLTGRLGKLPAFMRGVLDHVVLHNGDAGAYAEALAHFFVIYSDNMDVRISNNDLEETVFHESVHATLDEVHLSNPDWLQAQIDDGNFITEYAETFNDKEDLAESAIFVLTMMNYPGRLSSEIENWVTTHIPNRYAYIETIFD